jgi:hypothetical protein
VAANALNADQKRRAGFTTGTGDALEVVARYTKRVPNKLLAKFLHELVRINSHRFKFISRV